MLAVLWFTLGLPGIYGVTAALAINMAIAYGLSYLGGKLFGQNLKEAEDEPRGESFAWDPHTTHQEGIPRPVCFGRNQHHGNVIMRWTDVDPVSGNEILFKALDYGGGPVQGMDVVGGIVSDDDKCPDGDATFFEYPDSEHIDDWDDVPGDVNDNDKTTYVGFHGVQGYGDTLKGHFESIVTFAEAPTINRIEYCRYWYIKGPKIHQGSEKVSLWYAGASDWDLISTKNLREGTDAGTVAVEAGGPWERVTKVKIEVELTAKEQWSRSHKLSATVTYKLYELRAWRLVDVPVFLNDQPVHNFTEATVRGRLGTLNQTCMKGFEKNKLQSGPETMVVYDEPVRWTTPNKFFDDIEFTLAWLRGLYHYSSEGKVEWHGVGVLVEIRVRDAETWDTILETPIRARQLKALFKAYSVNALLAIAELDPLVHGTQYDLRFSKTTEEKTPGRYGDEIQLRSVREVVNVAFTHPGRALLGVIVQATERLQGNVDVKWITDDKLVQVYNSVTEEWDIEYSRNRAYIDLAIRTQPVITGDGTMEHPWDVVRYDGLNPSRVDTAKWYEWALWCDGLVPSGVGEEKEKRMPCDIICDRLTSVWSIAYEIAQIGRMYPYWQGVMLTGWIDKAINELIEPIDLITMDNTMANSWKNAWAGYGEMAGSVKVFYKDAQQGYARKPRPVHNKNAGLYTKIIGLEGVGVTSESLATRVGNHALKRNELIKNINSVRMGREALRYRLGRVVRVQSNVPNWGQSYRVVISPTSSTVQLDRVVEDVAENDLFWVKTVHATTKEVGLNCYTVHSTADKVVTIKETWVDGRKPLKNHMAAIGIAGSIKLRRIIKMQVSVTNYFDVELETYDAHPVTGLFTSDNEDPVLTNPDYVQPVTELVAPMSHQAVVDLINALAPPSPKVSKPQLFNCDWSGNDATKVFWSKLNPDEPILLTWQGETYEIAPSPDPAGTTLEFIYWDSTNPEEFQVSGSAAAALAPGMYLMCTNKNGEEHPADATQTQHGAIIQVGTLIAEQIIIAGINALGLMNAPAEAGADVTYVHTGIFREFFENPNDDVDTRWLSYKGSGERSIEIGGLTGGKFYRIGDNSGDDMRWMIHYKSIPYDESKLYRIRCRLRRTQGTGKVYIGVQGRNGADDKWVNNVGVNSISNGHWFAGSILNPDATWTVYTGYFRGRAASDNGAGSPNPGSPGTMHDDVRYFRPVILMNYIAMAGIVEIDEYSIDIIPEDAAEIAETDALKWAGESGADVTLAQLAGSAVNVANAERSIFTSQTPLSTAVRGTAEMSDAQAFIGTYSLLLTATDDNNFVYLGASSKNYNVQIKPNKKWIFSCWVRSSVSGAEKVRLYLKASGTPYSFYRDIAFADTWERISGVLDLNANASEKAILCLMNEGGNGVTCYFDGIMLEEQIGDNETPSPFAFPAGTIDVDYVPEGSTNKFAAESGADVTGSHQGDISLANLDEKSIDSLTDIETTYAKMLANWRAVGDTTKIEGGKIIADSITAAIGQIADLTVGTIKIIDEAVTTAKIDDEAATGRGFVYTAGEVKFAANEVMLQTLEFTTTGQPLTITFVSPIYKTGGDMDNYNYYLRLYRGAEKIYETIIGVYFAFYIPACTFMIEDTPEAGTYTYEVKYARCPYHSIAGKVKDRALLIVENKK